jgi:hypothetical protein
MLKRVDLKNSPNLMEPAYRHAGKPRSGVKSSQVRRKPYPEIKPTFSGGIPMSIESVRAYGRAGSL